jgi:hypothetical protein
LDDSVDGIIARVEDQTGGAQIGGMGLGDLIHQATDNPGGVKASVAAMQQNIQAQAAQMQEQAMAAQGFGPTPASGGGIDQRLAHLGELHSTGVLDDTEFAAAKRQLLAEL